MEAEILKKLGFEEQEIQIYLTLLKLGSCTASRIATETSIDRATCYRYLDSLTRKGLVAYAVKNHAKEFQAAHPEKILTDLEDKMQELKRELPKLEALSKAPRDDTQAELYTGTDGIRATLRDILREREDHDVLGDDGHFNELMPEFFEQFIAQVTRLRMKERVLCSKEVLKAQQAYDNTHIRTRSLPHDSQVPTTIVITRTKVILYNWNEPYHAVVIKNTHMAEGHRRYFEFLWQAATKTSLLKRSR